MIWSMKTAPVVTYKHAFIPGTTDLCVHHDRRRPAWVPVLGACVQGTHEGVCDACGTEDMAGYETMSERR